MKSRISEFDANRPASVAAFISRSRTFRSLAQVWYLQDFGDDSRLFIDPLGNQSHVAKLSI
jgi:hypothetical protein